MLRILMKKVLTGYDFDVTIDDHDDPDVTLVSVYGNFIFSV